MWDIRSKVKIAKKRKPINTLPLAKIKNANSPKSSISRKLHPARISDTVVLSVINYILALYILLHMHTSRSVLASVITCGRRTFNLL